MSPQTRRGRAAPANRKARSRADAGPGPEPVAESSKAEAPAESPVESRPHTEGKRARVAQGRHKRQHGTAYRWFIAYLPIMVVLFALLGALWVYTGFINPPPPTPAQQWAKIEAKWSPARETARAAVAASTLDFTAQQAAYKDFYTQTKGWVDAVTAVKDWGTTGSTDVATFVTDGQSYLTTLQQVTAATSANDVAALGPTLSQWDTTFTADVALVETDFKLPTASPAPSALALPSVNPTATPAPTGSPAPSGSPEAPATPAPTPGATATAVATASAAPTPS